MKGLLRRPATLKDIAQTTGYSINTISRALRDKGDIAPDTVERIKKIASEMGYINNALASSLRLGHTNMIAVILGDISNPHFSIMTKEIETRARVDGYSSFLINTNEDSELELKAIQSALNRNVDGIIICPSQQNESNIRYLIDTGLPFVQIGRYFAGLDAGYVVCNDELGGYQATRYLLENGHRDILMLTGPSYISSARERVAGYRRAFTEWNLPVKPELVREVPITSDGCAEVISRILREKIHFSAIFAFSDMLAWDAWTCLHKQGYRIPQDYSLIGFDNIQSRLAIPFQLSTISTYKAKMSTTAVECLVCIMQRKNYIHKEHNALCHHIIDTELVSGETVRSCEGQFSG
jgi:LacI family transcriptional regulator